MIRKLTIVDDCTREDVWLIPYTWTRRSRQLRRPECYTGTGELLVPVRKTRGRVPADFAEHFGRWSNQE